MADLSLVRIGNIANDGTGDDLREAFVKVNSNLNLLNNEIGLLDQTTARNIGGGVDVFAGEINNELQFKTLVAGNNISITFTDNTIGITNSQPAFKIEDDLEIQFDYSTTANLVKINSVGPVDTVRLDGDVLKLSTALQNDPTPTLGGNLQGGVYRVVSDVQGDVYASDNSTLVIDSTNKNLFGNLVGTVDGTDFSPYLSEYDFGTFSNIDVNNIFDLILASTGVEFGSVGNPTALNLDLGTIV